MMTPSQTITFICGIILCVIGVATFVTGLVSRAKDDGALSNKVDTALKGIDEIKQTLNEQRNWRETIGIELENHEQKIDTLFNKVESIERSIEKYHS